jgi:putative tricarboxylic transport membrane protein
MRAADLTTAAILIAGGLLVLWDSVRLGIGWGTDGPKSGFFPFWLAATMIVACAGILVQAWRRADREPFIPRAAIGPVLKVLGPAMAFVLVMQFLGMYVASALYMALYMRWIGRYSWAPVVLVSVAFPVITFWVFELWFLVPMPKGPLEAWLGY